MSLNVITVKLFLKNLCSGTQCGGFQFLLILDLWGVSFHAAVVFGLGKDFLFKSTLGHCGAQRFVFYAFSDHSSLNCVLN